MRLLLAVCMASVLGLSVGGCDVTSVPYGYGPPVGGVYTAPVYGDAYGAPGYYGGTGYYGAPGYYAGGTGYYGAPGYYAGGSGYRPYYGGGPVYQPGPVVSAPTVYGAPAVGPVYARPMAPAYAPAYARPAYAAPRMGVPFGGGWHGGHR